MGDSIGSAIMLQSSIIVVLVCLIQVKSVPIQENIQQNFQNLLNSLIKNDKRGIETNREALQQKAVYNKQAFDSFKMEIRSEQQRKSSVELKNLMRYQRGETDLSTAISKNISIPSMTITNAVLQTDPTLPKLSEETTQRLPEQNASWETIRTNNLLYIDKTVCLIKLLQRPGILWYVHRPPQFGKSSFIDMAKDYFQGKKDMFKGLAVENIGNTQFLAKYMPKTRGRLPKWKEFPVIHLNFDQVENFKTEEEFSKKYHDRLEDIARTYGLDPNIWSSFDLSCLISGLYRKFNGLPIIILVDEYDHPLHYAFLKLNKEIAEAIRTWLNCIFRVIKNKARFLGLALVTGVSKLSLGTSESTGIEAFVDLTFDKDLAEAFGFSETEIMSKMGPNLRYWAQNTIEKAEKPSDDPVKKIMEDLRDWYNGYQFALVNDSCRVFNPISTIKSVKNQECKEHWVSTGSLKHLIDEFYQKGYTWDLLKRGFKTIQEDLFIGIDPLVSPPPLHIWMLIFGYYTISSYDEKSEEVILNFPNKEIEDTLEYNIAMYIPTKKEFIHEQRLELTELQLAMSIGNTEKAMMILKSFVFCPYKNPLNVDPTYGEVTRRLVLIFRAARIKLEDSISFLKDDGTLNQGGDIDIQTINLPINYIFEIKCTKNKDDDALSVMKQLMGYLKHHPNNFMNANKNMSNYKIVAMNFQLQDGSISLNSWIALPCVNGIVKYLDIIAYPKDLESRFSGTIQPEYRILICGPKLP